MQEAVYRINRILAAIGLLTLDRGFKFIAREGTSWLPWGGGVFRFDLFLNRGVAFSIPFHGPVVWLLSLIVLSVMGAVFYTDYVHRRHDRLAASSFFILGALSNLFDRVAFGSTVDYLIFFSRSAVNLADAMIIVGAVWLLRSKPTHSLTNPS
jgi:lipoprotein signal peptidase